MKIKVNADKIKAWREERCWSQEHLADIAGISLRTIQRIEKGQLASRESVMSLAAAFDVDVSVLTLDIDGEIEKTVTREEARKMLEFKMSFWIHMASYVLVMGILLMINLAGTPDHIWVLWPAIGWGIGVLAHGATVFMVGAISRTEKQMRDLD